MSPPNSSDEIPTATSHLDSASVSHSFPGFPGSLGKHLDTQGKSLTWVTQHPQEMFLFPLKKGCLLKPEKPLKPMGHRHSENAGLAPVRVVDSEATLPRVPWVYLLISQRCPAALDWEVTPPCTFLASR